jgi:hypothetical protein
LYIPVEVEMLIRRKKKEAELQLGALLKGKNFLGCGAGGAFAIR